MIMLEGHSLIMTKVVQPLHDDPDAPTQSLLGLNAIAAELAIQGIPVADLFFRTGIHPTQLEDPYARISHKQRLAIYRNARVLSKRTEIALLAGARQRLSDYGIYGYAMLSSPTFGQALQLSLEHATMAGPAVRRISFRTENGLAILFSHDVHSLGDLLPFAAEFWRSSMTSLFTHVLEAPFPTKKMKFTYPRPQHWQLYERMFNCPVEFDSATMEWHFNAAVLEQPCPNANAITAQVCQQFCENVLAEGLVDNDLAHQIRSTCLDSSHRFPPANEIAAKLGLSLRTLHRRLSHNGLSYQGIIDDLRRSVAMEFLENSRLQIDQVAERVGFSDATSFRKAFKKWTGRPPSFYRQKTVEGSSQRPIRVR
jgi:AraC-like DNA-binding protein